MPLTVRKKRIYNKLRRSNKEVKERAREQQRKFYEEKKAWRSEYSKAYRLERINRLQPPGYCFVCQDCGQRNSWKAKKCLNCRGERLDVPRYNNGKPKSKLICDILATSPHLLPPSFSTGNKTSSPDQGTSSSLTEISPSSVPGTSSAPTPFSNTKASPKISRSPLSCVVCHKIRTGGNFKCGRCRTMFEISPDIHPHCQGEEDGEMEIEAEVMGDVYADGGNEDINSEHSCTVLEDFSANLLYCGVVSDVAALVLNADKRLKQDIKSIERDVETVQSSFWEKKILLETSYKKAENELNELLAQEKSFLQTLNQYSALERQATLHCTDLLTTFYVHVLSESQEPN